MAERYGLWPGVVALAADADLYCVPCAKQRYELSAVQAVIDGTAGHEQYTDHEGNPLSVVLYGSEGLHGCFCGACHEPLCDEECLCYQPGQAEYWSQYGTFQPTSEVRDVSFMTLREALDGPSGAVTNDGKSHVRYHEDYHIELDCPWVYYPDLSTPELWILRDDELVSRVPRSQERCWLSASNFVW